MDKYCVFVGGPIQYAIDVKGFFHAPIRSLLDTVLKGLREQGLRVLSAHEYENYGEMDVSGKFQEVCLRDFKWMKQCDIFVAVLPLDANGKVIYSAGTSVELGWASAMGKPIVLICDPVPVYSHLVVGLDAVARVAKIDINRRDLMTALLKTVENLLEYTGNVDIHHGTEGNQCVATIQTI